MPTAINGRLCLLSSEVPKVHYGRKILYERFLSHLSNFWYRDIQARSNNNNLVSFNSRYIAEYMLFCQPSATMLQRFCNFKILTLTDKWRSIY